MRLFAISVQACHVSVLLFLCSLLGLPSWVEGWSSTTVLPGFAGPVFANLLVLLRAGIVPSLEQGQARAVEVSREQQKSG